MAEATMLALFERAVLPGRRVRAKDAAAYGTFRVTHDITQYTKAKLFSAVGKKTDLFVRFSTVAGERGAADAERDIRSVAMKFYTEEGNWDLVGNNTPVFFLRAPHTNIRNARNNWALWTSLPEALHQVTITMSDRGIPASYRHMHAFGSRTFSFLNAKNERHWVKFHFHTQQGIKTLTDAQAAALIGEDRESHQRDLYESIERRELPRWTLSIQVMPEAEAAKSPYNPFDLTKVWLHRDHPLIEVGVLELDRNPANHHAEVEQAGFNPGKVVPGIGLAEPPLAGEDDDHYAQPGKLFRLMTAAQQQLLFDNTGRALVSAPQELKVRHAGNCTKADPAYGAGVARALGLSPGDVQT